MSKHEKDDPGRRDGQRPPDKPLPKEPDPGKHDKKDKK